jgi:hypothetical protein
MVLINKTFFGDRLLKFDVPTLLISGAHGYCDQRNVPLPAVAHYVADFVPAAVQTAFGVVANEIERAPYWHSKRSTTSAQLAMDDALDVARDKLISRTGSVVIHGGVGAVETLLGYQIGRGIGAIQEPIMQFVQQFVG